MADTEKILDGQLTKKEKDKILAKIDKYMTQNVGKKEKDFVSEYKRLINQLVVIKKHKTTWSSIFKFIANFSYNKIIKKKIVQMGMILYTGIYVVEKIFDAYKIFITNNKIQKDGLPALCQNVIHQVWIHHSASSAQSSPSAHPPSPCSRSHLHSE